MKNTQDRVNEVESSPKNKIKFKSVKQVIIEAVYETIYNDRYFLKVM